MQPKNLLFIMSDEHNASFMRCAGHRWVKTPNLDLLASNGTRFANAYSNSPICVPSRASFATGRYVHQCRFWDNATPYDGSVPSWGHRLMEQGHRVVSIGKLHYRNEDDPNGFDTEIAPLHVVAGVGDLVGLIRSEMPERLGAAKFADGAGPGETRYAAYDRRITSEAVRWLSEDGRRRSEKPWVLFVSFVSPHFPLIAPEAFYRLYPESEAPWPLYYDRPSRPNHPYYESMRRSLDYDKYFDAAKVRRAVCAYMGLCSFLDDNVGKILRSLAELGLSDETRIVYASDHGEALGKRGLWGKSTMFEESVAVPMILAGPDIPKGRIVHAPCSLVDCHPTILDAVGAEPHEDDKDAPGRSLFDVIDDPDDDRVVFSEYHAMASVTANYMVRKGDHKLCYFAGLEPEVYDLRTDPEERTNLADDPDYASIRRHLESELRRICDPESVDALAKSDQKRKIEANGGRERIIERGDIAYTPAPVSG